MSRDELRRTNIQALWRYMPGQPFNWSTKATVIGQTPQQVSILDVPEQWVAAPLRRLVRPFAEASSGAPNTGPELDIIDRGQFELVKADDLRAERFPHTFLCVACGRFDTVHAGDRTPDCPQHGTMEQFTFVEVHECGHIGPLRSPTCRNRCGARMSLHNTRALSTSSWYWVCTRCHTRSDRPIAWHCGTCRGGMVSVNRAVQTSSYYPQQLTILNPPTRTGYSTLVHEQVPAAAIAQALGVLPPGLDGLRAASGGGDDPVAKFEELAATIGWKPGDALYEQGIADARAKAGSAPAWRDSVDALGLDPEQIDVLGDECRQLSLAGSAQPLGVSDLLTEAVGTALEPTYRTYQSLFDRYGLLDVTLLRQLPVAYIVAGYTRVSSRATTVGRRGQTITPKFRFFPPSRSGRSGKMRMYGVRTETEGLLFRLDPVKIVTWLVDSGVVDDPHVSDAADAQRWLFQVTDPVTELFTAPENRISRAVLGLTHSFAHRAMKSLAARCGLNVDSLAEYLFPSNGAFLIYANTRSEFILGGLEHVYRFDVADALTELDAESRCVFDPPCRHSFGGSCAACLYVSEVACARFNTVLDRNLLFGTIPDPAGATDDEAVTWPPYWSS